MPYLTVDVDMSEFDTEDLVEELKHRNLNEVPHDVYVIIEKIWLLRRTNQDYQKELDNLIYTTIGKIQ